MDTDSPDFSNVHSVDVMSAAKRRRIDEESSSSPFPPELLENIFCHLPLSDLLLGAQLACKQWHSIVANGEVKSELRKSSFSRALVLLVHVAQEDV